MRIFTNPKTAWHTPAGEIKDGQLKPPFDQPRRIEIVLEALRARGAPLPKTPPVCAPDAIAAVHDPSYVRFLETAHDQWLAAGRTGDVFPLVWPGPGFRRNVKPNTIDGLIGLYAFDSGTPIAAGTWDAVRQGADAAVASADALSAGEDRALCLTRPPGHHAMRGQYGGYCFLNFAAIAAQRLRDNGAARVAVLDVDYHHGNGTQDIFYDRGDVLVVNLHADPIAEYPYYLGHADEIGVGEGEGATLNLPLPAGTDGAAYSDALAQACAVIARFGADALVLSYGADTFEHDLLGRFKLTTADMGRIGTAVRALKLPVLTVLEGGYAVEDLGRNVVSLIAGLEP
ncbi:MAG: histone deacetylase family protein [Maricaulaceae bacterium]